MLKRLLSRFSRERSVHKATVRVDFFPQDLAVPQVFWHDTRNQEHDTVVLSLFLYARILYELAELNETRVAKELMAFLDQIRELVASEENAPKRPQLPLGAVHLGPAPNMEPPLRRYQANFYELHDGSVRLEFKGSIGKEGFYLPAAFLAFVQSLIDDLPDDALKQLISGLGRLHTYYRYRKDFWDGSTLTAGPVFALGKEEIATDEAAKED